MSFKCVSSVRPENRRTSAVPHNSWLIFNRAFVFGAIGFNEQIKGGNCFPLCFGHLLPSRAWCMPERANVLQTSLGLFMHWLGYRTGDACHLVNPAALFFHCQIHVPQCSPKSHCTIPTGQVRYNLQPSFFQATKKI